MDMSPVPIEVVTVTTFFFVMRSSSCINARYAAVKAPEVITLNSFVAVIAVRSIEPADIFA
jgi:hypothetical protein